MGKYDSGYEKVDRDFYATPHPVTQAILVEELISTDSWLYDPACGDGHIMDAGAQMGVNVLGTDLRDTGRGGVADFLTVRWMPKDAKSIITNPPYGDHSRLAVKFIEHALKLTKPKKGRVIMLLPVNFDCGKTRKHLFGNCLQFVRKYTLTDRIRWANLPQKEAGPKENHAWFVWSHEMRPPGRPDQLYIHGTGI